MSNGDKTDTGSENESKGGRATQLVDAMRAIIQERFAGGTIPTDAMLSILQDIEDDIAEIEDAKPQLPDLTPYEFERYKAKLNNWSEQHTHLYQWQLENFKQMLLLAQSTFRAGMLLNGGAAVAILAFLQSIATQPEFELNRFAGSLETFGLGALLAACGFGFSYFSQYFYDLYDLRKRIFD